MKALFNTSAVALRHLMRDVERRNPGCFESLVLTDGDPEHGHATQAEGSALEVMALIGALADVADTCLMAASS